MRTRYLVCYDVRDAARLRRTAKVAEEYGYRLNYSVFVCDLSEVEHARFERRLRDVLDVSTDSAFFVDIGPPGRCSDRRLRWLCGRVDVYTPGEATVV